MIEYRIPSDNKEPLYVFLYKRIKTDIESNAIKPHEKLPSKRSFARSLGVGVITVEAAYAQLVAEGYIYSESRRGYFACDLRDFSDEEPVSCEDSAQSTCRPASTESESATTSPSPLADTADRSSSRTGEPPVAPWRRARWNDPSWRSSSSSASRRYRPQVPGKKDARTGMRFDLTPQATCESSFAFSAWTKALRDALSEDERPSLLQENDPFGSLRLRKALSDHLLQTRDLRCDPSCIVIGAGMRDLCNAILQLIGRPQHVAVEDPSHASIARIYETCGASVVRLPLDEHGIDVQTVQASNAKLIHIMPSHQFPTGSVMSANRRRELLAWANEGDGRYIVEDDYDGTLRLAGKPVSCLQGIDRHEHVIHLGTFAQTLGCALRIAYAVLPAHLAKAYKEISHALPCSVSPIEQAALARFIEQGDLARLENRTKTRCRNVRDAFVRGLGKTPAAGCVSFEGLDAGPHFVLTIEARRPNAQATENKAIDEIAAELEASIVAALARQDVAVEPLPHPACPQARTKNADDASADAHKRIPVRFAIGCTGLSVDQARPAAEAFYRGIARFI